MDEPALTNKVFAFENPHLFYQNVIILPRKTEKLQRVLQRYLAKRFTRAIAKIISQYLGLILIQPLHDSHEMSIVGLQYNDIAPNFSFATVKIPSYFLDGEPSNLDVPLMEDMPLRSTISKRLSRINFNDAL
jgi:hypothetical protein